MNLAKMDNTEAFKNAESVWNRMKEIAKQKMSKISYETWIKPCKALAIVDDNITILAENALVKKVIERRHVPYLEVIARTVTNEQISKINVVLEVSK